MSWRIFEIEEIKRDDDRKLNSAGDKDIKVSNLTLQLDFNKPDLVSAASRDSVSVEVEANMFQNEAISQ